MLGLLVINTRTSIISSHLAQFVGVMFYDGSLPSYKREFGNRLFFLLDSTQLMVIHLSEKKNSHLFNNIKIHSWWGFFMEKCVKHWFISYGRLLAGNKFWRKERRKPTHSAANRVHFQIELKSWNKKMRRFHITRQNNLTFMKDIHMIYCSSNIYLMFCWYNQRLLRAN